MCPPCIPCVPCGCWRVQKSSAAKGLRLGAAGPESLIRTIAAEANRRPGPHVRLLIEPGRALVSECFHLVTRVLRVRETGRRRRIYLDGSRMAHAYFVARGRHPFSPIPFRPADGKRSEIAGPLGVELDLFTSSAPVGRSREGDLVVIGSVGAYNLIAANAWCGAVPEVEMLAS